MNSPDELTGPYGTARRIPRAHYAAEWPATLDAWIITASCWHPFWSQYTLAVITLADVPGMPAAVVEQPDMTHQIIVMAMNPDRGPYTPDSFAEKTVQYLTPGNIGEQFPATDDRAVEIAELCVRAVVDGVLNPETADSPARVRALWSQTIQRTLDHDPNPGHSAAPWEG